MSATEQQLQAAKETGTLEGKMDMLITRVEGMDKKLDGVVATMNRWKGATAILVVLASFLGYFSNAYLKFVGKA